MAVQFRNLNKINTTIHILLSLVTILTLLSGLSSQWPANPIDQLNRDWANNNGFLVWQRSVFCLLFSLFSHHQLHGAVSLIYRACGTTTLVVFTAHSRDKYNHACIDIRIQIKFVEGSVIIEFNNMMKIRWIRHMSYINEFVHACRPSDRSGLCTATVWATNGPQMLNEWDEPFLKICQNRWCIAWTDSSVHGNYSATRKTANISNDQSVQITNVICVVFSTIAEVDWKNPKWSKILIYIW